MIHYHTRLDGRSAGCWYNNIFTEPLPVGAGEDIANALVMDVLAGLVMALCVDTVVVGASVDVGFVVERHVELGAGGQRLGQTDEELGVPAVTGVVDSGYLDSARIVKIIDTSKKVEKSSTLTVVASRVE